MMTTPDAVPGFESILPDEPVGWEPEVPARIIAQMRADRPIRRAHLVSCPLLVCVCERDAITPVGPAVAVAHHAPRGELRCYPIGHFDLFSHPWFDRVADDQIAFLNRALHPPSQQEVRP